jgi:hypothetical protein
MISPGDTILIAGDSWGCGEWSGTNNPYHVTHLGLEHFLIEYGCSVINLSEAGSTNYTQAEKIKLELSHTKPDVIIWFQTDPMRDLGSLDSNTFPKSLAEMKVVQQQRLDTVYEKLNNLRMPIYCIGGVTKLDETLLVKYNNLKPIIPSVIEMFGGTQPSCWISSWIQLDSLKVSDNLLTELEEVAATTFLPREWFFPDGVHPNRKAHYRIFEYILTHHK